MNESTNHSASEKPVHKWPIRPGVHVHVNGLHVLNNSNASETKISGFSYGARNNSTTASDSDKDRADLLEDGGHGHGDQTRAATSTASTVARGTSTSDMMRCHNNETIASAASAASNNNGGHGMASPKETTIVNNSNSFEFAFCIELVKRSRVVHEACVHLKI